MGPRVRTARCLPLLDDFAAEASCGCEVLASEVRSDLLLSSSAVSKVLVEVMPT